MYEFKNLPRKGSKTRIIGRPPESEIAPYDKDIVITDSDDWVICRICTATPQSIASDIADAIRFARDAGYEQAFEDMRIFFGINK